MKTGGLLAIFAHPDDETFGIGGTMAHYAGRGIPVTIICATRGEVGEIAPGTGATPETLGQFREEELREAMGILGVTDVRFLDYRDSGMRGTPENDDPRNLYNAPAAAVIEPMVRVIRERRPDAIVTWDASGGYGHPDHIATHEHATSAFNAAADPAQYPGTGDAWQTPRLFYTALPLKEWSAAAAEMKRQGIDMPDFGDGVDEFASVRLEANCQIDVLPHFDEKIEAMLAHRTQITKEDPFMRLPLDYQRRFFGTEHFARVHPPMPDGVMSDDLLADL